MRKIRSSTKIAIGFAALVAISVVGYNKVTDMLTMREKFAPIVPGRINIVGINPGSGYRIIVANDVAQLVETQGSFGANDSDDSSSSSDGAVKKRISVKDILGILQGDGNSLVSFVRSLNDLKEDDLPPIRVVWKEDKLKKALDGDKALQAKLVSDLNVNLDGAPRSSLNLDSLENGIVIQTDLSVTVTKNGKPSVVVGHLQVPFKPNLIRAVETDYADKPNPNASMRAGYYKQEAEKTLANPGRKEDVRGDLADAISDKKKEEYVAQARMFLASATVVVNDSLIEQAKCDPYATTPSGKPLYNLTIDLNDEGRRRLAQFSRNRVGDQILLVSDGVAIAAARIEHPLFGGEVTISHMADKTLLDDFIDTLKSTKGQVASN